MGLDFESIEAEPQVRRRTEIKLNQRSDVDLKTRLNGRRQIPRLRGAGLDVRDLLVIQSRPFS
jgi:hypothetical protein